MENKPSQPHTSSQPLNDGMSYETKTIIVVLLFLFFYPAGVILMWIWMKWPTWVKILLTILPFLFAFLILLFVFAVLGIVFTNPEVQKEMQKNISVEVTQSSKNEINIDRNSLPEDVVKAFYTDYTNCMDAYLGNPPGPQACRNSMIFNSLSEEKFREGMKNRSGGLVCGQNVTTNIQVDKAKIVNDEAEVTVHQIFEGSGDTPLLVGLNKTTDGWKISSISCLGLP